MPKFNVGDKVRVRDWYDMEQEYGSWDSTEIRQGCIFGRIINHVIFTSKDEHMCGRSYYITKVITNPIFNEIQYMLGNEDVIIHEDALELVNGGNNNE